MGEQITYSLSEAIEESTTDIPLCYFTKEAFDIVRETENTAIQKTKIFAQLARLNALYMIAKAGSGHLGSSFSSLDIVSWLYLNVLKSEDRYYSSKGHDSPGLYAVQSALGIIPFDKIHGLRRIDGLPGHPDVNTPGAHTNTGSLGMGVSKAKGFLFADDLSGKHDGRLFVLTGDGELQEGQFWESLVTASRLRNGRLTVIVDHNKIQSDTYVRSVSDLGDLEAKFASFGWDVSRCDGHDYEALEQLLNSQSKDGRPKVIIADTIKGKGVSFMEHTSMKPEQEFYKYHSGAPGQDDYKSAIQELVTDINEKAFILKLKIPNPTDINIEPLTISKNTERMVPAYSEAILNAARSNNKVVALDADLILDTGLIPFKEEFPERFIECGIAEQDMVSQAGTIALAGYIPIVHSFACFLTTRPSEQIYNNCSQGGKVIYVGSLAGVLPGGPGHSHQAVRDIAGMLSMPNMTILEPINAKQVASALSWAVNDSNESVYIRLTSIPYEQTTELSQVSKFIPGQGECVRKGDDLMIICFGPILSFQAMQTAEILADNGIESTILVTPWINRIDTSWLRRILGNLPLVVTLENHFTESGAGSYYVKSMANSGLLKNRKVLTLGVDELPACGSNDEVLAFHGLTANMLASNIIEKHLSQS
ncbi:transketolase [Candidatus Pseudothioglobus singularis]|nr:transketolase [Candidatus Pseudothioglobus singularis]